MLRRGGAGCPLCPRSALAARDGSGQTVSQPVTLAESCPQSTVERASSPTGTPLSFYLSVCLKTQVRCTKCDAAPSRRRGHPGRRSGGGSHMGMRTPKPLCSTPISEPPTDRLLSVYPPHPQGPALTTSLQVQVHAQQNCTCAQAPPISSSHSGQKVSPAGLATAAHPHFSRRLPGLRISRPLPLPPLTLFTIV